MLVLLHSPAAVNNVSRLFFHSHLSHPPPFYSWLCTCCRSWNRRTSFKQPRRVATGASWQKTTCCGGRSAGKKVSRESSPSDARRRKRELYGAVGNAVLKKAVVPGFKINLWRTIKTNMSLKIPSACVCFSSQASTSLCPSRRGKSSSLASLTAPGRVPTSGSTE